MKEEAMDRKTVSRLLALPLTLGLSVAPTAPVAGEGKAHDLSAEVVSVDLAAAVITIREEAAEKRTVPVLQSALDGLKTVNAGDKVTLTCQDNEKGEHQG
jgi:hypothetical protein